jgi:hypothetical protein
MYAYNPNYMPTILAHVEATPKQVQDAVDAAMGFPVEQTTMTGSHKRPHNPRYPKRAKQALVFRRSRR